MAAAAANLAATAGWSASSSVYGVTGQVNLLNISGGVRQIAFYAVSLHLDPDGTGVAPKWEMPDEAEERIACQRYWRSTYATGSPPGTATTSGSVQQTGRASAATVTDYLSIHFETRMRATPTITVYPIDNGPAGSVMVNGVRVVGTIGAQTDGGFWVRSTAATGLTSGAAVSFNFQYVASARL
jgi:hypothetical protein